MNGKNFLLLLVGIVILGFVFNLTSKREEAAIGAKEIALFSDLNPGKLKTVRVEKADSTIEFVLVDNVWRIASRGGYPADPQKINSLLLRTLDARVNQKVTDNSERHEDLGVGSTPLGGKVVFADDKGVELGTFIAGDERKANAEAEQAPPVSPVSGAQYVRRGSENQVYLYGTKVELPTTITDWIDVNVLNVRANKLSSISQYSISEAEEPALNFTLSNENVWDESPTPSFALDPALKDGQSREEGVVTQVRSGLENFRITDVFEADDQSLPEVQFDRKAVFSTVSGATYTVLTGVGDSKIYAKIEVSRDDELVSRLQQEMDERSKEKEEAEKSEAAEDGESQNEDTVKDAEKALEFVSAEDVDKLNSKFQGWVFVLAEYQGKKFRMSNSDFVKTSQDSQ